MKVGRVVQFDVLVEKRHRRLGITKRLEESDEGLGLFARDGMSDVTNRMIDRLASSVVFNEVDRCVGDVEQ